uniref:response regulator transcription factor n=1 Tax=Clavibacter michiganensis TaxID=28447 RepID=UPI002930F161
MILVVLVDDQSIVRAGFRVVLETAGGIEVGGEAAGGREAGELLRRPAPDVVVMDVRMPGGDCIEATRATTGSAADASDRRPGDDRPGHAAHGATTYDLYAYL